MSHLPVSPFFRFSPLSLRPGVVGVCFEAPGCNVMPERLLFVISGILAGGIPGFRMELCCFSHPLTWPIGVFCGSFVLLLVLGHFHNDTQDVIMHVIPIAGGYPTSLCRVCFGLVVVVFFVCLFLFCCFLFAFLSVFLLGQLLDCVLVHYQHFCGFRQVDSLLE